MPGQTRYSEQQIHGASHYRVDGLGTRVLVLPATDRHGHHMAAAKVAERDDAPYHRLVMP